MPKETEPSSYECDCGYMAHFFENTVNEVKERSRGRKQWLSEGAGIEKHIVVFQDGEFLTMLCPSEGRHDEKPAPRFTAKQGQYQAVMRFTLIDESARIFGPERFCFRGSVDDWIPIGGPGTLAAHLRKFVKHLGQESFYELF